MMTEFALRQKPAPDVSEGWNGKSTIELRRVNFQAISPGGKTKFVYGQGMTLPDSLPAILSPKFACLERMVQRYYSKVRKCLYIFT